MSFIDDVRVQLQVWEGYVPHLYMDSANPSNATTGCGHRVASLDEMQALLWLLPSGALATPEDIHDEWVRVTSMPGGHLAQFYACPNMLTLSDATIDSLTLMSLNASVAQLRSDFPGFDSFPDPAKAALLDMDYNLGSAKLRTGYPRMNAAVNAGNWTVAAAECGRNVSDPAFARRNAWTAAQFRQAASMA